MINPDRCPFWYGRVPSENGQFQKSGAYFYQGWATGSRMQLSCRHILLPPVNLVCGLSQVAFIVSSRNLGSLLVVEVCFRKRKPQRAGVLFVDVSRLSTGKRRTIDGLTLKDGFTTPKVTGYWTKQFGRSRAFREKTQAVSESCGRTSRREARTCSCLLHLPHVSLDAQAAHKMGILPISLGL